MGVPAPASTAEAMDMVLAGLGYLAAADPTVLAAQAQAECLQMLEQAAAIATAARARILAAFTAGQGYAADADYSPTSWLIHRTKVTKAAARAHLGWASRAAAHPQVVAALAEGTVLSESMAGLICGWTGKLPESCRDAADGILVAAARAGARKEDLAALAAEIYARSLPDSEDDPEPDFEDRQLRVETTFAGASVITGDLTPDCAAVVTAVLEALSAPMGAEDTRTKEQRYHDALGDAMRRLVAAGLLPERAGQPVKVWAHVSLAELRALDDGSVLAQEWIGEMAVRWAARRAAACEVTARPRAPGELPSTLSRLDSSACPGSASSPASSPPPTRSIWVITSARCGSGWPCRTPTTPSTAWWTCTRSRCRRIPRCCPSRTRVAAAQLLGAGLDPDRCTLFVQSHVPEHTELAWILGCITGFGEASRMTQFKDKSAKEGHDQASVGLFTYPILQAADILLYQADQVPVGEDQRQHLELSRTLAQRFNHRYGQTFVPPQPYILAEVAKIYDLQDPTAKMSKSSSSPQGIVDVLDEPDAIRRKIARAVTDPGSEVRADPEAKPGVTNLLRIYSALSGEPVATLEAKYAGTGYGGFKKDLAEVVVATFAPIREKTQRILADEAGLDRVLAHGAARARQVASQTMTAVRDRMGLLQPAP